ncbi:MAG: GNAT family N-acetyltransferase [Pleurocapsa sp. SU_196_0]|nr:GNAT family N-acetyltransferase [Pleurocapsa sp. SU_196_0]
MSLPITTTRLRLRHLEPRDAATLVAYRSDPSVARFQSWTPPYPQSQALELIAEMQARDLTDEGWTQVAVVDLETDALLGDIGVRRFEPRHAEIGFTLARQHQGRGIMREALEALLEYIFTELGVHRVIANTDVRNHASQTLLTRLGFRLEAVNTESWLEDGQWFDEHGYALLEREWKARS